jgi:hypothetical protein
MLARSALVPHRASLTRLESIYVYVASAKTDASNDTG